MDGFDYVRHGEEPYMQFTSLKLRSYLPHEIEKLSVLRITQTKTFDDIGHPIRGGLYDPLLGPGESRDRCDTCNQYEVHCPGHMGHIRLDVPVFNPLLFPLLKGSCVHCHRFMCKADSLSAKILLTQLRCFELGVSQVALDLEGILRDQIGKELHLGSISLEDELEGMAELDKHISQLAGKPIGVLMSESNRELPSKNNVALKKQIIQQFLKEHLFRRRQKCPLCQNRNGILRNDGGRCLLIDFTSTNERKKKKSLKSTKSDPSDQDEKMDDDSDSSDDEEKKKASASGLAVSGNATDVTIGTLAMQMRSVQAGECDKLAWRGAEVREHFRLLFFPMLVDDSKTNTGVCPLDGLFCEQILVPPRKFRPIRMFKGQQYEDPQTLNLRRVLEATETIKAIALVMKGEKSAELAALISDRVQGKTINAQMHNAYLNLQLRVNAIFDEDLNKGDKDHIAGIKQILEKKQGLFRMHMMGKRVNFACRSVITPDPYLDIDEIGIPDIFAKKLTFTEPVNAMNLKEMKALIRKGPKVHPGANFVTEPNGKRQVLGDSNEEQQDRRKTLARTLIPANTDNMVMMNRQPSLHKPSIMGHRARVLTGQRALRMNYAPCKAYNADFDGDEMNGHLVQTHVAQSEVREIANVGSNFLVPKDATPLLGLIQDHVVSGVLLTLRDRFLNKEDFMHLVLASFAKYSKRIEIPPPTILVPQRLWTGKQVISTIVKNITPPGKPMINLDGKAKTPLSCWVVGDGKPPPFDMSESHVIFRHGELLVGVLDKAHFGATQYGLGHCVFELYGHRAGVQLLSCFSRLFTTFLQFHGFTLGVADILVQEQAEKKRREAVEQSRTIGDQVVKTTFGLAENASKAEIKRTLAATYCNPRGPGQDVKMLDFGMKQAIAKYNDAITKSCVPTGLIRPFPQNALQLMIQSGAKGSAVNAIQISGCLGQIELEGKRMAVTIAGRTLPSFRAFDPSPRAGGYIDQRFLTGMNPQELFFHTMAGREGLIDTAVKTSRSGYLQRCIIKHLEGIRVHYDNTVRDHDGSIIQFRYGEDGMDVIKSTFLNKKTMPFFEQNLKAVTMASKPEGVNDSEYNVRDAEKRYKKICSWRRKTKGKVIKKYRSAFMEFALENTGHSKEKIIAMWAELDADQRKSYEKAVPKKCPSAVDQVYNPNTTLGALPEKMLDEIHSFCNEDEDEPKDALRRTMYWKGMRSMAEPGENVGLLAAQSIGEPSTQMTLNTFHFAGRGEMNVTLGIPRLREILMTASKNIATPSAQIAVIPGTPRERIDAIKQELDRVYLKQVLKNFVLDERITLSASETMRKYILRMELLPSAKREQGARHLSRSTIMQEIEKRFISRLSFAVKKKSEDVNEYQQLQYAKLRSGNTAASQGTPNNASGLQGPDRGESSDEEADGGREADASEKRLHNRHRDEAAEYEGEEEERGDVGARDEEEPPGLVDLGGSRTYDLADVRNELCQLSYAAPSLCGKTLNFTERHSAVPLRARRTTTAARDPATRRWTTSNGRRSGRRRPFEAEQTKSFMARVQDVMHLSDFIFSYKFDEKSNKWCEVVFQLPLRNKTKFDFASIVEREADVFIVHQTPGIERCVEREEEKDGKNVTYLQTQGVNLQAFFKHADVLDVNSVYSNDLNLVLTHYGVEACSRAIVTEMNNVFAVYGIEVSRRHLSLTADYMTFTGEIAPFNRGAMAACASPLQKMTFETTIAFMREALLQGEEDSLNSPSARLVVGSLSRGGTGCFDLSDRPDDQV
ncbi:unnamed protein product [Caenorhabditis auriculariae]|uniref:DNA-directed RNA polymerase subunit n=1 Tax=Caenorhabditis auriculariae TaxID=2777116 RepID=A0A8S1HHB6_9PELO|nr:unnamed protein product [Caenorhabditis auriculariae]